MATKTLVLTVALGLVAAVKVSAQQPSEAAALYTKTCASCHGAQGTPSPAMAHAMAGIPDFKAASMASVADSVLSNAIANGKGRMMASYKTRLTPAQISALVSYIRTLSKH